MDVPGFSVFQGAESIKLNTSEQQRIEEEDALEDRLRRNEELKNELQNAFDDLADYDDDEDVSLSQTGSSLPNQSRKRISMPQNHIFNGALANQRGHPMANNNTNNQDISIELRHLKNVLASKSEELKNLTAQAATERTQFESQINELKKRLAITEAEKERANMSRQQTHELFVESKQKLSEREECIVELNAKIKLLDQRNLELMTELEHTKSTLTDVQHKYHIIERNGNFTSDKHTDAIVKQLNDRHAAQTDMLQQQVNAMRSKLEDKENELKRLLVQNNELHKSREAMLLDKSETINQLSRRLEDSQRQCQNLIIKTGTDSPLIHENLKLVRSIAALEQQNEEMQKTINGLTTKLESTNCELEQLMETAINENDNSLLATSKPSNEGITDTPMIRRMANKLLKSYPSISSSTPLVVEDQLNRMKHEFNRCVTDQKMKRHEIVNLKEQLVQKEREIESLKADENRALVESNIAKEKADRLANRLKSLERDYEQLTEIHPDSSKNQNLMSHRQIDELRNQIQKLEKENDNFRTNCDHLNQTIKELEDERDRIEEKYRDACLDIAELQGKLTLFESQQCSNCEKETLLAQDAQREYTIMKDKFIKTLEEKEELSRDLSRKKRLDVHKELNERKQMIVNLRHSLELTELKCNEMTKILDRERIDYKEHIDKLRTKYEHEISRNDLKDDKDTTNLCGKCVELSAKVAKFDVENLKLQTNCSSYLKDIHELKKSLTKAENRISELTDKWSLKVENDQVISELKTTAKQFEEFMLNQSPTHSKAVDVIINNQQTNRVRDQCVSTDDLNSFEMPRSASSTSGTSADRSAEQRIREDMARAMAIKVKDVENQFKNQIYDYEKHLQRLTAELGSLHQTLDSRNMDISNLKRCILTERTKTKTILDEKDTKLNEQNNLLMATRTDFDAAKKRIEFLTMELDDCGKHFEAERQSINKLMTEWKAELTAFAEREELLNEQIQQMESEHKVTVQNVHEKYMAAKKTAANYKKYSEEKEKHIERESERIRSNYEQLVRKNKENMETIIKEHEKRANKQIAALKCQIDALQPKHNI